MAQSQIHTSRERLFSNAFVRLKVQIKLQPTPQQQRALLATMERFNAACDAIADVAFRDRCAHKFALHKLVYYDIRARFGLSSQLTIRAIAKVAEAYKRDRNIQPHFRPRGAITYDQRIMSWKGAERVSLLTVSGRELVDVVLGLRQPRRMDGRLGQADLIYRKRTFYLYATIDGPEPPPVKVHEYLGIDLGIVNLAVDSDGVVYSGDRVERQRRIFTHRRRNLQRKRTKAARRKLRAIRKRQARFQRDTNHCISKRVVAVAKGTERGIALEQLLGIRERITVRKRQRARHSNWAFAQLGGFINYKARLAGVPVVLVDARNTSRTCLACGHIAKANRPSQAHFECVVCGFAGPSDAVAACVIAARARAEVIQPMVSENGAAAPAAPGTSRLL
jgi:putative transposase